MSWKKNLLRARSYIAVMTGFLIASGIVLYVETHMPKSMPLQNELTLSHDFPDLPEPRALTLNEAIWARIAWQYFVNNTQPSGLVNSIDNQPYSTMWDTGNYLIAMISAERLGIISHQEFNDRMRSLLTVLSALPLTDGKLPAVYYHSRQLIRLHNLDQNESQPDWSAVDISRLLISLNISAWLYPEHAPAIQLLTRRWRFDALFIQREPEKRLSFREPKTWQLISQDNRQSYGYQLYALNSLRRTNILAGLVLSAPFSSQHAITIDGVSIPYDGLVNIGKLDYPVVSNLPFLLTGLEVGFDINSAEMSWRIMKVQENRYKSTGDLAWMGTDYEEHSPRFENDTPARRSPTVIDKARKEVSGTALQLSTRSVFAWYALFRTQWNTMMRQRSAALFEPGRGWYDGIVSGSQQRSNIISATTNAAVLESLVYLSQGPLFCQNCMPASSSTSADGQQP
ncbi:DUF3131 domain-containing protein [Salmonella enterica]|nr:DUF3131 domain-containing protein [Salmonella enterica]EKC2305718.1 DUF3131 domain-containing protein [Salmonella enterica]EKC2384347.1 DUF3131 domain-containing protein [Salmonella enterica]EKC2529716.1 DUF3131 domain-containing protein [Salmonella enterica]EKC2983892.1 DUF3131 domain-containing protein [Salmonella enterica]